MSRIILAIVTGTLFFMGDPAPQHVPLRQSFVVVPRGTEVVVTITESSTDRISATVAEDVVIDDAVIIHKGSQLSGNGTELTRLDDQPVLLVPVSLVKTEDPTMIAGSILIGAVVGHQINLRRPEVGALMGGISGLAVAAGKNTELVPTVGDRIPFLIQRDLTVRL